MKKLGFYILIVATSYSLAQSSGYLGKRNNIQLNAVVLPTIATNSHVHLNEHIQSKRVANLAYQASYNHVFTNYFELSVGYQFAMPRGNSERINIENAPIPTINYNPDLLEDLKYTYHGAFVGFNFYRKGSMAPIGKYWGFIFDYGMSSSDSQKVVYGTTQGGGSSGFLKESSDIIEQHEAMIAGNSVTSFGMRMRIGRSLPINKFMTIYGGVTFPFFYFYNASSRNGMALRLEGGRDIDFTDKGDWQYYQMNATKGLSRISLETGIRVCF